MRKVFYLSIVAIFGFFLQADAQINNGGFPKSYDLKSSFDYTTHTATLPNWDAYIKEEESADDFSKPYLIGLFAETNIQFPASGDFYTNEQGDLIWKTAVEIAGAPAIGLYFDQFYLPKGVSLFIHNDNQKHVLGAYTNENNSEDGMFAIEAIQGQKAYIELNFANADLIDDVQLHIDRALVYFRAYENTLQYASEEDWTIIGSQDQFGLEGSSSICMINANCSQGDGYEDQKRASVQIIVIQGQGAGLCSATIINSHGNTKETCRPLLLTASHCESTGNVTSNQGFSQLLTRFNFEKDQCTGGAPATVSTMTGANFLTRSAYNPNQSASQLTHDFLLLELRNKIPAHYNAYLSGIRLNYSTPSTAAANKRNIGFHHPAGDVKKLIYSNELYIYGNSPQSSTHWVFQTNTNKSEGGAAQGSSGSGLFDANGYYMGTASTAGNSGSIFGCSTNGKNQNGAQFFNVLNYYQVQKAYTYTHQNPVYKNIKSFINPNNANIDVIEGLDCNATNEPPVSIEDVKDNFASQVKVYPNPANKNEGLFIQTNFRFNENLSFRIFDIQGKLILSQNSNHVKDQVLKLDISDLSTGMYLLEISNGIQKSTQKIMVK